MRRPATRGRERALVVAVCALLAGLGASPARAQDPVGYRWRQLLSPLRPGEVFTAFAVDPLDPLHVFVGTDEGMIYSTHDGVTWQEYPVAPGALFSRRAVIREPWLIEPDLNFPRIRTSAIDHEAERLLSIGAAELDTPTFDQATAYQPLVSESEERRLDPNDPSLLNTQNNPQDLIALAVYPHEEDAYDVSWISYCPGARYPLLVSTQRDVFGSDDDGESFVRIFAVTPGSRYVDLGIDPISQVVCNPIDPAEIVVTTNYGVLRSTDGGLTFREYIISNQPGAATATTFDDAAVADPDAPVNLLVASETLLFVGDPDSEEGLQYIYPSFGNISTAPFGLIRWITTTASAQIWFATDQGLRASLDGGVQFIDPGPTVFGREPVSAVVQGWNHQGNERVAASQEGTVWATDDAGMHWEPFFVGLSRRDISMMSAGDPLPDGTPPWWVLTEDALWTNVEPARPVDPIEGSLVREHQDWARARILRSASMPEVIEAALGRVNLRAPQIWREYDRHRSSQFLPVLDLSFDYTYASQRVDSTSLPNPLFRVTALSEASWSIYLSASWYLPGSVFENPFRIGTDIIRLEGQIRELIEDVWHERMNLLVRMAHGGMDFFQAEVMRSRVETIEGVLSVWVDPAMFFESRSGDE